MRLRPSGKILINLKCVFLPPDEMHLRTIVSPTRYGPTEFLDSSPDSSKIEGALGGTGNKCNK